MSYNQFPNRRRVIQACVNCRMRKTRCDAAQPRCGLCTSQNVDCVYRDAKQPKIDYNTQVLLERMQLLEDRILSSNSTSQSHRAPPEASPMSHHDPQPDSITEGREPVFEVQIPLVAYGQRQSRFLMELGPETSGKGWHRRTELVELCRCNRSLLPRAAERQTSFNNVAASFLVEALGELILYFISR
ncbi:3-oxoacyl-reductase [Fusarium subglutinans]|uniref:3-oxoacyl-reductase n=1 Tax=Gibberella subglutinans TaxID=42677 RepID=A0A8H5PBF0_GIBSU|nr:3-oxoacyl-reductase [Fusarium subglutinans]KAF5593393.1 3-oxoacyl-reductase [Fusarium subglutinans]